MSDNKQEGEIGSENDGVLYPKEFHRPAKEKPSLPPEISSHVRQKIETNEKINLKDSPVEAHLTKSEQRALMLTIIGTGVGVVGLIVALVPLFFSYIDERSNRATSDVKSIASETLGEVKAFRADLQAQLEVNRAQLAIMQNDMSRDKEITDLKLQLIEERVRP